MSTTDNLADPIVSSVVSVLSVPLVELYALLWRAGVVEIAGPDRTPGLAARLVTRVAPSPRRSACPDPSAHALPRSRRQLQRRHLAPGRFDRAAYIPAVG
ncbi:Rv1535 domain-containing protein [Mycobacterium numidiamassiliense]|uniref:Rv1535 domain-containing protein n=1 Tax=Mycobacterium numidiamassiliense TaxID=1841861 RepID=UPI0010555ABC|nr:Rv1535 domain-containing protein [Mycobacterium numidiamassiliense]